MRKTKEDTSTVEASKITVDYKNKRITITPPKKKGFVSANIYLDRCIRFANEFVYIFMAIYLLFLFTSTFVIDHINKTNKDGLEITYTGIVKHIVYTDRSIILTIFGYGAIFALIGAFLTKGFLLLGNLGNKAITLSAGKPKYILKIKTTEGLKEWKTPIFYNCCMFYRAGGDFGKYLEKIKIRKFPIKYIRETRLTKIFYPKMSSLYWQGTFIFKEIPKKGYLEIRYK